MENNYPAVSAPPPLEILGIPAVASAPISTMSNSSVIEPTNSVSLTPSVSATANIVSVTTPTESSTAMNNLSASSSSSSSTPAPGANLGQMSVMSQPVQPLGQQPITHSEHMPIVSHTVQPVQQLGQQPITHSGQMLIVPQLVQPVQRFEQQLASHSKQMLIAPQSVQQLGQQSVLHSVQQLGQQPVPHSEQMPIVPQTRVQQSVQRPVLQPVQQSFQQPGQQPVQSVYSRVFPSSSTSAFDVIRGSLLTPPLLPAPAPPELRINRILNGSHLESYMGMQTRYDVPMMQRNNPYPQMDMGLRNTNVSNFEFTGSNFKSTDVNPQPLPWNHGAHFSEIQNTGYFQMENENRNVWKSHPGPYTGGYWPNYYNNLGSFDSNLNRVLKNQNYHIEQTPFSYGNGKNQNLNGTLSNNENQNLVETHSARSNRGSRFLAERNLQWFKREYYKLLNELKRFREKERENERLLHEVHRLKEKVGACENLNYELEKLKKKEKDYYKLLGDIKKLNARKDL